VGILRNAEDVWKFPYIVHLYIAGAGLLIDIRCLLVLLCSTAFFFFVPCLSLLPQYISCHHSAHITDSFPFSLHPLTLSILCFLCLPAL